MISNVGIIGMGALGVLYGDILTKALGKDKVFFILDEKRIDKYNNEGVYSNGEKCDFSTLNVNEHRPLDLIIIAVKYTSLDDAINSIRNFVYKDTIIISVLNGIISEDKIMEVFKEGNVIHCVAQGMDAVKLKNNLTFRNVGALHLGIIDKKMEGKLNELTDFFNKVNMPYILEEDILKRIWSKFMLNVGVNQVVMVYEGTYKTVQQDGEPRELMINAMKEVIEIANVKGINIGVDDLNKYLDILSTLNPEGMPSMRQDGLLKRKTEKDLFSKTVIELGKKYNIDTPINAKLYKLIVKIEEEY